MTEKIKYCPFCHNMRQERETISPDEPEWRPGLRIVEVGWTKRQAHAVKCDECGGRGPAEWSPSEAVKSWNNRGKETRPPRE